MKIQEETLSRLITEHDEANDKMIQHFGDDTVRIEIDKKTDICGVFINGDLKECYENLSISELENLQRNCADAWFVINKFNSQNQ